MLAQAVRCLAALLLIVVASGTSILAADAQPPARAIVLAWDGVVPSFVRQMLSRGKLPNLARLIAGGAFADDVIPVYPSKTAPGFASLWTGAPPATTGISGNWQPRTPAHRYTILDTELSFLHAPLRAEPLWATALRAGRKVTLAHVPFGRELSDGAVKLLGYDGYAGRDGVISSRSAPLQPATGWQNLPASEKPALEFQFTIAASAFFGVVTDDPADPRRGYDTLLVSTSRDGARAVARLKEHAPAEAEAGLWAGPVQVRISGGGSATLYLRLFELDAGAKDFMLYHTRPVKNTTFPTELAPGLLAAAGVFVGNGANFLYQQGALGAALAAGGSGAAETRYLETVKMAQRQLGQTALWAVRQTPWDLLFLYTPFPDEGEHLLRGYLDGGSDNPRLARAAEVLLEEIYKSCDDLLGMLLTHRPDKTLIAVVSDHGMAATNKLFAVNRVLQRAGLLVLNDKGLPDLTKTKAFYPPGNNGYILINSTSRKGGIVSERERAAVIEQLRRSLLAVREDGRAVVTALYDAHDEGKKLGIGGDAGGDLYLDLLPGYDFDARTGPGELITPREPYGMHGFNPTRPTMRTMMVLNGPGIAAGKIVKGARLIDFAPTLARSLRLPAPKNASGRVLEEMFAGDR